MKIHCAQLVEGALKNALTRRSCPRTGSLRSNPLRQPSIEGQREDQIPLIRSYLPIISLRSLP
jgi:hypothetical protein